MGPKRSSRVDAKNEIRSIKQHDNVSVHERQRLVSKSFVDVIVEKLRFGVGSGFSSYNSLGIYSRSVSQLRCLS